MIIAVEFFGVCELMCARPHGLGNHAEVSIAGNVSIQSAIESARKHFLPGNACILRLVQHQETKHLFFDAQPANLEKIIAKTFKTHKFETE